MATTFDSDLIKFDSTLFKFDEASTLIPQARIEKALNAILKQLADEKGYSVRYQGFAVDGDEVALSTPHLQSFNLPAESQTVGIAYNSSVDMSGIFQINAYTQNGSGMAAMWQIVSDVMEKFERGASESIDGTTVLIEKSYTSPMVVSESWQFIPVSINYRAIV